MLSRSLTLPKNVKMSTACALHVNGMCELCTEDILFENPEWVTKNKADFKMKMKKEFEFVWC